MRIGTRWQGEAPAAVPRALAALTDRLPEGYWTLTWLEGRAVVTHESGARFELLPSGEVQTEEPEPDDWLS